MTVSELRAALVALPDDMEVIALYEAGSASGAVTEVSVEETPPDEFHGQLFRVVLTVD